MRGVPFHAIIGGARFLVRKALDEEPGTWTLVLGEQLVDVDEPKDLLKVAAPGDRVSADFGAFSITMWRDADRTWYSAAAEGVAGAANTDLEEACWALLRELGDDRAPKACFFCKWSDVEPSTTWGNMGCAVANAAQYEEVATSSDGRRRKWGPQPLMSVWVDEWFACERFTVRPKGFGYRGRW